jgi:hypothetical protein
MCCAAAWLLLLYLLLPAPLPNPQPCCTLPGDAAEASSNCCSALLLLLQLPPAWMQPSALVLVLLPLLLLRGLADALCCLLGVARAGATAAAACGPFGLSLLAMVPLCTDARQQLHIVRPPNAPLLQQTGLQELLKVLSLLLQPNSSLLALPGDPHGCALQFINLRAGVGLAAAAAAVLMGLLHGEQCLLLWLFAVHVAAGPAAAVSAANLVDRPAKRKQPASQPASRLEHVGSDGK